MAAPPEDVLRFIADQIDTVPQIEALLVLWQNRPATFTAEQLAARIFVSDQAAGVILTELHGRRFAALVAGTEEYVYDTGWDPTGEFMARVAATYRRHLILIATLIHRKTSSAVREFARAFEPKKDV